MSAAPDYAQPLSGWRAWLVAEVEGAPRLVSVVYHVLWPPRQALVGECLHGSVWQGLARWRGRRERHATPDDECSCGIYAASQPEAAVQYLRGDGQREVRAWPLLHRVLGRVLLWGTVVECEAGWRGARAYPHSLYLPELQRGGAALAQLEELAWGLAAYGVPIEILEDAGSEQAILQQLQARRQAA